MKKLRRLMAHPEIALLTDSPTMSLWSLREMIKS